MASTATTKAIEYDKHKTLRGDFRKHSLLAQQFSGNNGILDKICFYTVSVHVYLCSFDFEGFDRKTHIRILLSIMCCSIKYPYPSHGRFFGLNPPTPLEFPLKPHTFLLKFWLLRPPTPSEFPLTFHGVGMDIFWNCKLYDQVKLWLHLFILVKLSRESPYFVFQRTYFLEAYFPINIQWNAALKHK